MHIAQISKSQPQEHHVHNLPILVLLLILINCPSNPHILIPFPGPDHLVEYVIL